MGRERHILIAGGSSTIGNAVAERLRSRGDQVIVTGRVASKGMALARAAGAWYVECDLDAAGDLMRMAGEVRSRVGALDGLVVAVGALHVARLSETTDDAWDAVLDANLVAPFLVAQTCLPLLRDGGSIVVVGSGTAQWPEMELGAYSVAKRAVERLCQVLAMECALRGINVNVVNPGELEMPMSATLGPAFRTIPPTPIPPLGRRTEPGDVVAVVEFFLSEGAEFCTGASLTVDGGLRAALRANKVRQ